MNPTPPPGLRLPHRPRIPTAPEAREWIENRLFDLCNNVVEFIKWMFATLCAILIIGIMLLVVWTVVRRGYETEPTPELVDPTTSTLVMSPAIPPDNVPITNIKLGFNTTIKATADNSNSFSPDSVRFSSIKTGIKFILERDNSPPIVMAASKMPLPDSTTGTWVVDLSIPNYKLPSDAFNSMTIGSKLSLFVFTEGRIEWHSKIFVKSGYFYFYGLCRVEVHLDSKETKSGLCGILRRNSTEAIEAARWSLDAKGPLLNI